MGRCQWKFSKLLHPPMLTWNYSFALHPGVQCVIAFETLRLISIYSKSFRPMWVHSTCSIPFQLESSKMTRARNLFLSFESISIAIVVRLCPSALMFSVPWVSDERAYLSCSEDISRQELLCLCELWRSCIMIRVRRQFQVQTLLLEVNERASQKVRNCILSHEGYCLSQTSRAKSWP